MSNYHDNKVARMIEQFKGMPLKDLYKKYIYDADKFGHIVSECMDEITIEIPCDYEEAKG